MWQAHHHDPRWSHTIVISTIAMEDHRTNDQAPLRDRSSIIAIHQGRSIEHHCAIDWAPSWLMIDGCFDICFSWTAIMLRSVFYLPICTSYFLSKMAIIRIWVRQLVFGAMPITQYSCPHCNWWLFWHLLIKLNSDQSSIRVLSANLCKLFLVKDGNNSHLSA
jgi:hypothetical protein